MLRQVAVYSRLQRNGGGWLELLFPPPRSCQHRETGRNLATQRADDFSSRSAERTTHACTHARMHARMHAGGPPDPGPVERPRVRERPSLRRAIRSVERNLARLAAQTRFYFAPYGLSSVELPFSSVLRGLSFARKLGFRRLNSLTMTYIFIFFLFSPPLCFSLGASSLIPPLRRGITLSRLISEQPIINIYR